MDTHGHFRSPGILFFPLVGGLVIERRAFSHFIARQQYMHRLKKGVNAKFDTVSSILQDPCECPVWSCNHWCAHKMKEQSNKQSRNTVCNVRSPVTWFGELKIGDHNPPPWRMENMTTTPCKEWRTWTPLWRMEILTPSPENNQQRPANLPCQTTKVRLPNRMSRNAKGVRRQACDVRNVSNRKKLDRHRSLEQVLSSNNKIDPAIYFLLDTKRVISPFSQKHNGARKVPALFLQPNHEKNCNLLQWQCFLFNYARFAILYEKSFCTENAILSSDI